MRCLSLMLDPFVDKRTFASFGINCSCLHCLSYPSWVIDKVFKQVQQAQQVPSNTANEKENDNKNIRRLLLRL